MFHMEHNVTPDRSLKLRKKLIFYNISKIYKIHKYLTSATMSGKIKINNFAFHTDFTSHMNNYEQLLTRKGANF